MTGNGRPRERRAMRLSGRALVRVIGMAAAAGAMCLSLGCRGRAAPSVERIPRSFPWEAEPDRTHATLPFGGYVLDPDVSDTRKKGYEEQGYAVAYWLCRDMTLGRYPYLLVIKTPRLADDWLYKPKPLVRQMKWSWLSGRTLSDESKSAQVVELLRQYQGKALDNSTKETIDNQVNGICAGFRPMGTPQSEGRLARAAYNPPPRVLDSVTAARPRVALAPKSPGGMPEVLESLATADNLAKARTWNGEPRETYAVYPFVITEREDQWALWDSAEPLRKRYAEEFDFFGRDAQVGPYLYGGDSVGRAAFSGLPCLHRCYTLGREPEAKIAAFVWFQHKNWDEKFTPEEAQEKLLGFFGLVEDEREEPGYRCETELRLIDGQYAYVRSEKKTTLVVPNDAIGLVIPKFRVTRSYRAAWLTEEGLLACIEGDGRYPKELVAHFLKMHPSVLKPEESPASPSMATPRLRASSRHPAGRSPEEEK